MALAMSRAATFLFLRTSSRRVHLLFVLTLGSVCGPAAPNRHPFLGEDPLTLLRFSGTSNRTHKGRLVQSSIFLIKTILLYNLCHSHCQKRITENRTGTSTAHGAAGDLPSSRHTYLGHVPPLLHHSLRATTWRVFPRSALSR